MRRSIATACLSGMLEDKLAAIAASHFDAAEIDESDLVAYEGTPRDLFVQAQDLGLDIDAYHPSLDFEGVDQAIFRKNLDRAERKFDLMLEMGAPLLLLNSNTATHAIADAARIADQLHVLAERAGERGLKIGYKAVSWGTHIRHVAQAWDLVSKVKHPHLGLVLHNFHLLAAGDGPAVVSGIPGERIFFVQVADAPKTLDDTLARNWRYSTFPGQGDLDIGEFLKTVLLTGYAGSVSLEIWNDAMRTASPRSAAGDGYRSLLLLEERVASENPHEIAVELFDPAPAPEMDGVSFIEFAADGAPAKQLDDYLRSFGFSKAGMHRSKNVTLYRQGGVNLVLNAEPDSFAQSYFLLHGPSICALGLRTKDEQRAVSRALDYHCAQFSGRIGPNDLSIPAIRAPDGSLIYFVGSAVESGGLYEIEFRLEEGIGTSPITGIDHVAYALPEGELDSWVLYYRAVLGFEAEATYRLADPNGVVNSRAVASGNRSVRIPLNIGEGGRTTTAQSVESHGGARVHHVAFATTDIFDTATNLDRLGARLLAIPSNYYDDLESRFDLGEDLVEKLRRANILYDRIGTGTFFHIYSEPFQDGFFFEFVQRAGGYDGYGAANAPVRLSALARLMRSRQAEDLL